MTTNTTSEAVPDRVLFRWWHKGLLPDGELMRLDGRVLADDAGSAGDKVDRVLRKIYPTVRWMHGRSIEGAGEFSGVLFGPTVEPMKTVRLGPEWAHMQEGIFVRVESKPQAQCPDLSSVQPQKAGATELLKVLSAQALAQEVIARRMIGNLLVIKLQKYMGLGTSVGASEINDLIDQWRQIPAVR